MTASSATKTWPAVLGLVIVLHQLVIDANQQQQPRMSNVAWGVLAVFLVFVAGWVWSLVRRFRLPEGATAAR